MSLSEAIFKNLTYNNTSTIPTNLLLQANILTCLKQRQTYLQKNFPHIYLAIKDISLLLIHIKTHQKMIIDKILEISSHFQPFHQPTTFCNNSSKFGYSCKTCKQDQYTFICQQCFDLKFHQGHQYNWIKNNLQQQCCCSVCFQNSCKIHSQQRQFQTIESPKVELYAYIIFFQSLWKSILAKGNFPTQKILSCIKNEMKRLNKSSKSFNIATLYIFCMKQIQNQQPLFLNCKLFQDNNFIKELFNYEPFQFLIAKLHFKQNIDPLVKWLRKSHQLLALIAQKQPKKIEYVAYEHLDFIFTNLDFKLLTNAIRKSILQISRFYFEKDPQAFTRYFRLKKQRQTLYTIMANDQKLGQALLIQETKFYIRDGPEWINVLMRIAFHAAKGNIFKISQLFKKHDKKIILKITTDYFSQIYQLKRKVKFNGLTIRCLFQIAKSMDLLQSLKNGYEFSIRKFSENVLIFLRNLICTDHMITAKILEIALINDDSVLQSQCKKSLCEWFKDFLFISFQTPKQKIKTLREGKLIDFPEALEVLRTLTEYIPSKQHFLYIGPIRQVNQSMVLMNVSTSKVREINEIKYLDKNYFSNKQEKKQIINTLFGQHLGIIMMTEYSNYTKTDRYLINLVAVLLDILAEGENPDIKSYVERLIQANSLFRHKNPAIQRLYSNTKSVKITKQSTNEVKQKMEINQSEQLKGKTEKIQKIFIEKTQTQQNEEQDKVSKVPQVKLKIFKSVLSEQKQIQRSLKLSKLQEKYQKKTEKFISKNAQQQQNQLQCCIICRQSSSSPINPLVYFVSLTNDTIAQYLFDLKGDNYIVSTCFHAYHKKCLAKKCVLCNFEGNLLLPVFDCQRQQKIEKSEWQQIQKNKTFLEISKKTKTQSVSSKKVQVFMSIWRCFMNRIGPLSFFKVSNIDKKLAYFNTFLKHYYAQLCNDQQNEVKKLINKILQTLHSQYSHEYMRDLFSVAAESFLLNLQYPSLSILQQQSIRSKVIHLTQKHQPKHTINFVYNMSKIFDSSSLFPIITQNKNEELIQKLFTCKIPQSIEHIYNHRSKCHNCQQMSYILCLICLKSVCSKCVGIDSHNNSMHSTNLSIHIDLFVGNVQCQVSNKIVMKGPLYFDDYKYQFEGQKNESITNFTCSNYHALKLFQSIAYRY